MPSRRGQRRGDRHPRRLVGAFSGRRWSRKRRSPACGRRRRFPLPGLSRHRRSSPTEPKAQRADDIAGRQADGASPTDCRTIWWPTTGRPSAGGAGRRDPEWCSSRAQQQRRARSAGIPQAPGQQGADLIGHRASASSVALEAGRWSCAVYSAPTTTPCSPPRAIAATAFLGIELQNGPAPRLPGTTARSRKTCSLAAMMERKTATVPPHEHRPGRVLREEGPRVAHQGDISSLRS